MRNGFCNVRNSFFLGAHNFAQIFTQILVRRFFFDVLALEKIGIPKSHKKCAENLRKNPAASTWPCSGGGDPIPSPHSCADSTSHNVNRRQAAYSRRACEGLS